jgi:hypothetical protein
VLLGLRLILAWSVVESLIEEEEKCWGECEKEGEMWGWIFNFELMF